MSMSRIRSNFSPSRPLQLCFEAACGTSLARDKYTVQSTQKSRRGRIQPVHYVLHECVVGCPILSSMHEHVPINHRVVGIDHYFNHVVVDATSSNLCIIYCMKLLYDVQFYQACMSMSRSLIAAWALICYCNHVVVSATSSNLCIIHCMNLL